jgi:carboxylesterase type B
VPPDVLEANLYATFPVQEDCLFLDVYVPRTLFEKYTSEDDLKGGKEENKSWPGSYLADFCVATVLVWIHGGGFTIQSKDTDLFNPSGLIAQSQADDLEGVIFVKVRVNGALVISTIADDF